MTEVQHQEKDVAASAFTAAKRRFEEWISQKPTGTFSLHIEVNQGGIRGKPKIAVSNTI